jgi:hypothetical protein
MMKDFGLNMRISNSPAYAAGKLEEDTSLQAGKRRALAFREPPEFPDCLIISTTI